MSYGATRWAASRKFLVSLQPGWRSDSFDQRLPWLDSSIIPSNTAKLMKTAKQTEWLLLSTLTVRDSSSCFPSFERARLCCSWCNLCLSCVCNIFVCLVFLGWFSFRFLVMTIVILFLLFAIMVCLRLFEMYCKIDKELEKRAGSVFSFFKKRHD